MFVACYAGLGALSYHDDARDSNVAAQLARQRSAEIRYMHQPFQPEAASSPPPSAPASADPLIAKGAAIFAAGPCRDCHGARAEGTDKAPALIGVGQKYSADSLTYLLHHRTAEMIDGGMPPVDLDPASTAALVGYLRSLK
jgi:ubiquinol-cytochrome c reductase cytochrome b subunit